MSCLLCFQSILNFDILDTGTPREYCERIFESCNKHLSREIRGSFFQWTYSDQSPIPLCLICLELSEKLTKLDDELETHIELFTNTVLSARKQINLQPGDLDNNHINSTAKLSSPGPSSSTLKTQVEPVKEERINIELIKDEENSLRDGFSDLDDSFIIPDSPPYLSETSNYGPDYVSSAFSANTLPELRVTLNRLTFDKNGKVIIPGSKITLGKRKAAISAIAAMMKKLVDEETNKDTNVQNTSGKRYSSDELKSKAPSSRSRIKSESGDSSSDEDKKPVVKRRRRRRKNNRNSEENNKRLSIPRKPTFKCAMCDSKFHFGRLLDSHSEITGHVTERNFQCENCEDKFYTELSLKNHMKDFHEIKKRVCKFCDHVSETRHEYINHNRIHLIEGSKNKPKFKCDQCDKSFYPTIRLTQHKVSVHGIEAPFTCNICGVTFTRKYHFSAHMEIHQESHEIPKRTCKHCGHVSKNYIEHSRHVDKHSIRIKDKERHERLTQQKNVKGKYTRNPRTTCKGTCEFCDEVFDSRTALRIHKTYAHKSSVVVSQEKPNGDFLCQDCGKIFKQSVQLDTHIKVVHLKEISFECSVCKKSFANKPTLQKHEKMHSGITYDCEICGKGFYYKTNLISHTIRIHEMNKPPRKSFSRIPGLLIKEAVNFRNKQDIQPHPPQIDFQEPLNNSSIGIIGNNAVSSNCETYFPSASVPKLDINNF